MQEIEIEMKMNEAIEFLKANGYTTVASTICSALAAQEDYLEFHKRLTSASRNHIERLHVVRTVVSSIVEDADLCPEVKARVVDSVIGAAGQDFLDALREAV